jgi:hypothetical protein
MRKCPQCGYIDPLAWRSEGNWGRNRDICNLDDFKMLYPNIAEKLTEPKIWVEEGDYAYSLSQTERSKRYGGGIVRRVYLPEHRAGSRAEAEKQSSKTSHKLTEYRSLSCSSLKEEDK